MNRQFVAFLSLFSLVLVLSVYYVIMPTKGKTNAEENLVSLEIQDAVNSNYEMLSLERDKAYKEYVASQNVILASSSYSGEEKAVALQNIDQYTKQYELEKNTEMTIKNSGYQNVYVEFLEDYINIKATAITSDYLKEVANIIYIVQDYLDDTSNNICVNFL